MVATGTTLVQIISEPTKPLSLLVTLHNVLEHTEGPPNQPWMEVYVKVASEIDGSGFSGLKLNLPGASDAAARALARAQSWTLERVLAELDRLDLFDGELLAEAGDPRPLSRRTDRSRGSCLPVRAR